ncbi:hypothetical protein M9H77_28587 [Catharanthus roseus]|uniref:Uncharacterized protein n=1 Tax=Catharanthus roseus TaxID=4058 RepID=A0ACC0AGQ6_CATRO|nr:hypothetical protein M9H77_28587 [Catharanthus roseus]
MDHSIRPTTKSKFAKTFQRVIHPTKSSSKTLLNNGFCLLIPQEKLKCCESQQQLFKEEIEEAAKESKNRAVLEAFVAKLFATISSVKAAYAQLQMAQFPYNNEAIQSADQAVVDELKALSELKQSFLKKQIDSSPPHVTLLLAEIQEQQSLMKTYEITMKKMQNEIEIKESQIVKFRQDLNEIIQINKSLEKKMNASGSFSVLDNIKFSSEVLNPKDFLMVLNYGLRSVRNFVKFFIKEMESANWDIEAAANSIHQEVKFFKKDHKGFAFESFVCREIFGGFNDVLFGILQQDHHHHHHHQFWTTNGNQNHQERRVFYYEEFKKVKSVSVIHFLKQNANSFLAKFLKFKYLQLIHPKMEFSFFGNLNQRKLVNSGIDFPETEFFKNFAEMGRRIWILHCLAFSFDQEQVSIFQVKKNCRFSELYMESVTDEVFTASDGDFRVAFTVVPGFRVGKTVVQSQVYLQPSDVGNPRAEEMVKRGK